MRGYKLLLLMSSAVTTVLSLPHEEQHEIDPTLTSGIDFKVHTVTVTVSNPTQPSMTPLTRTQHLEARDNLHISGEAPNAIWRMGKAQCQPMANSTLWLDCMANFHQNLGNYYNAKLHNDHLTAPMYHYQAESHQLYQWATDECTLTEGSNGWMACMEIFRNEISTYFDRHLARLTPKRDEQDVDTGDWNPFNWSEEDSDFPDVNECDADLPTEPGKTSTYHLSAQGQEYTAVVALEREKPHVFKDIFYASGTKHTVIISQFPDKPTSVAQTVIWGSNTNVEFTSTSDAGCIGRLTSVDFGRRFPKRSTPMPTIYRVDERPTQTVNIRPASTITYSASTVPITAPTQIIDHTTFIRKPNVAKYHNYDPQHPVAPTGSCHKLKPIHEYLGSPRPKHDEKHRNSNWPKEIHEYNETECAIEKCMWEYMKPIDIATVTRGLFGDERLPAEQYGHTHNRLTYFTYKTRLHGLHWGLTEDRDVYYPRTTTHVANHSTVAISAAWATPTSMNDEQLEWEHIHRADPECEDMDSCLSLCQQKNPESFWHKYWPWIMGSLFAALLLMLIACCYCCFRRRDSLSDKFKRKPKRQPTEKPQTVDNQTTGQPTDQNGNPVSPETAATAGTVAGSAAGAEAARRDGDNGNAEQSGNDGGRGTTGRRAEEGRGRVNFEDGGKPGQDQPSGEPKTEGEAKPVGEPQHATTEEKPAGESAEPKPMEHAEPQPVPDKDGAGDGRGLGRLGLDVGSLRGRKRNRPEGIAGLGF